MDEALKVLNLGKNEIKDVARIQQVRGHSTATKGRGGESNFLAEDTFRVTLLLFVPVGLRQQYDKYFTQNDPGKGGSFYLQVSPLSGVGVSF